MTPLFDTPTPRVFTIPPAISFLDALAKALLQDLHREEAPFGLSDAIILLPTRRAARGLSQAFLTASPHTATLLPRIRTLGDLDPEDAGLGDLGADLDAPPAIDPLARRLILARLIQARDSHADWSSDPASALMAADALADLLDSAAMMAPEGGDFDWSGLSTLVTRHELARHWEHSTTFLSIVTEAWPAYLASTGQIDPGVQQRRNVEALIERWQTSPPQDSVVLAGSTGSMPVTRKLMHLVSRLPRGMVILPGLDTLMPEAAWAAARHDDQHPQRAMAEAIEAVGVARDTVAVLPGAIESEALAHRRSVIREALTPQANTADWPSRIHDLGSATIRHGLEGLTLIEADSEDEEANLIAHEMRETLESPDKTAALVTPSAEIARRVAAKLQRWDIKVDISSGRPLRDTAVGSFLQQVLHWAADPSDPVQLCALLGHPLTSLGRSRDRVRALAGAIEVAALRGPRRDRTLAAMITRLGKLKPDYWPKIELRGEPVTLDDGLALLRDLATCHQAAGPLAGSLQDVAQSLARLAEALAATDTQTGADSLWRGEAGESVARFLSRLMEHGGLFPAVPQPAITRTLLHLMADLVVRPRGTHPRLAILGPLEARLLQFDKVILGGLDEGVWPQPAAPDPFLSRPMRQHLGLPSPDSRIGLSAHDFAQFSAAPRVILTRSARRKDAPAVPSRWLWRLKTLAGGALGAKEAADALAQGSALKSLLRAHAPSRTFDPLKAIPAPRPPVEARPRHFHATHIETWIRDPYRTYVEKILSLRALDPLGGPISSSVRGNALHKGFEIVADWHENLPDDPANALGEALRLALVSHGYDDISLQKELARLDPTIAFLADQLAAKIKDGWRILVEEGGTYALPTPEGPLTLKGRADRIDVGPGGTEIYDYKSGKPPSAKEVGALMSPQMPVLALIAARAGFDERAIQRPTGLMHIHIGTKNPTNVSALAAELSMEDLIQRAEATLLKLSALYHDAARPYLPKPRVSFIKKATYEDPVDRLSRRAEWANAEDGE